ncbi:MAG: BF3164 family lipoprotein [Prolixibacteraceae bacterium]
MNRLCVFVWPLFLVLQSCSLKEPSRNQTISFSTFEKEDTILFRDVYEFKEGVAGMMRLSDSTLIIYNVSDGADHFLYNYSLEKGRLSSPYLKKGRGPGEAIGAAGIGISGNSLWIQDVTLKKLMTIDKNKAVNDCIFRVFNEYKVKDYPGRIDLKDSLHYFSTGFEDSDFRIQEFDLLLDQKTNEYAKYHSIPRDVSFDSFKSAHQTFIFSKPTGDKVVLPYRFMDAVGIFDIQTGQELIVHGPEGYEVKFKPLGKGMVRTAETRFAFVNGAMTNRYIYLSYSGMPCNTDQSSHGRSIYVYDWNGNPQRKLILNRLIESFVVTDDDRVLYAYDVNSGFLIQANIE